MRAAIPFRVDDPELIPNIGDWIDYTILGRSVIIVRAKDGVKAFHNACR